MTQVVAITHAVQKAQLWLDEIDLELGWSGRHRAYLALRAVLHALRDRLGVDEAADLAAQLPVLVRGIYFEGWNPSATPKRIRGRAPFLAPVERALCWQPAPEPAQVTRAVFGVLARNVSRGEIDDVLATLPESICELFPFDVVADWQRRRAAVAARAS